MAVARSPATRRQAFTARLERAVVSVSGEDSTRARAPSHGASPARGSFSPSHPRHAAPALACDCHVHVLGPYATYPLLGTRPYSPPEAPLEDVERVMGVLGIDRLVLVQPSVYGTDNRCMLDAMRALGDRVRGVAVIPPEVADTDLEALHAAGVRGVRINARTGRPPAIDALRAAIADTSARLAPLGWHVQLYVPGEYLEGLTPAMQSLPTDFVIDHLGDIDLREGARSRARAALLSMVESGRCWVKISGTYRLPGGDDPTLVADVVRELCELRSDRLLWASDWPHTGGGGSTRTAPMQTEPLREIDTGALVDMLAEAVPDAALRRRILVENPARLYEF